MFQRVTYPTVIYGLVVVTVSLTACVKSDSSARSVSAEQSKKFPVVQPATGGEMVLLPGGHFTMGDAQGAADETPHRLVVDAFYIDRYPVTQRQYEKVMKTNPSKWKSPDNPVEQLQWVDAVRFCNRCSELEGLGVCYDLETWKCDFTASGYRLPTEAEWEYACRAGTTTRYSFGDDPGDMVKYGWCKPHSQGRPHPVGEKRPNPWGLFDMHGNVWQWCNDYYSATYYSDHPGTNPRGPEAGKQRVLRGGSWKTSADACRSAIRQKEFQVFSDACFGADSYGFRRVRNGQATPPSDDLASDNLAMEMKATASNNDRRNEEQEEQTGKQEADGPVESKTKATAPTSSMPSVAPTVGNEMLSAIDPARLQGWIVYVSDRSGALDIWRMKPDGSDQIQLTNDAAGDADPRFSPDGQQILYTSLRGGFPEVWTMQADGSKARRLTEGSQAAWAPDGKTIVFIRDDRVMVRQLDTGTERQITPPDWNRCGVPAWNPDGTRIAIASRHLGTIGVFLLTPEGTDESQLATDDPCCTPAWAPNGRRITFQTVKGHVHELDLASGQDEQLTFGADIQRDARYSPDGTMITFCRAPTEEGPWQICILDLESDDLDWVQITKQGSNQLPDWWAPAIKPTVTVHDRNQVEPQINTNEH